MIPVFPLLVFQVHTRERGLPGREQIGVVIDRGIGG